MPTKAILRTANDVVAVANDVAAHSRYRASAHTLPVEGQSAAQIAAADMLLFVDRGAIEMMVEGATGYLRAGEFAQIGAGHTFGYRNCGTITARVLIRPLAQDPPECTGKGVVVRIAAA